MRLPKDQYLALKKFKKEVKEEFKGKVIRDHSGHLYKVHEDGSIRRLGRDELSINFFKPARKRNIGPAFGDRDDK